MSPFRRTVLVGGLALLGGCISTTNETAQETETVLSSITIHNHYEKDLSDAEAGEREHLDTGFSIGVIIERDGELVQWSEDYLEPGESWAVESAWAAQAGNWTVHASEVDTENHFVRTEWPTIDLGDFVESDDIKDVAVDVIIKETGRIDLDATPVT